MIKKSFLLIAPALAMIALSFSSGWMSTGSATAGRGKLLDQTGCSYCPVCDHACKLEAKQVDEQKTCFNVESKAICIPRVVFPWQKAKKARCAACDSCGGRGCTACVHNGARVRKVCVLKTEKYECTKCKYTWTAEKKASCSGGPCGGSNVCVGGCASGGCDAGYAQYLPTVSKLTAPIAAPIQPMTPQPATTVAAAAGTVSEQDYYRVSPAESTFMPAAPRRH